jgi:hypothetical protein
LDMKWTRAVIVATLLLLLCGPAATAQASGEGEISAAFVFHFNQSLVPYAEVAERASYIELLRMLRSLEPTPFVLHIFGTLLLEWQWSGSEALGLVKDGIAAGQFEILGSTFAQNIIYSIESEGDSQFPITLHRETLREILGVEPAGFWNPERVWDPGLVDLIARNSYAYTFIETPILSQSGAESSRLRRLHRVSGESHSLYLIADDLDFRNAINRRDPVSAVSYLRVLNRRDQDDSYLVVYAEDAEATGLWDLEANLSPQAAVDNLRRVLVRLIEEPQVRIVKIGDFIAEKEAAAGGTDAAADQIGTVTGQPRWMISPSVALGYTDWFDYNAHSPDLAYFRELYGAVSAEIARVEGLIENADSPAARQLIRHARQTLAIAQYEFAAVGAGGPGDAMWELARTALVPAFAAEAAVNGISDNPLELDVNRDGVDEFIVVDDDDFYVFSPIGAKLLYWFDLSTGDEIVGSENSFYYGERFVCDGTYVPPLYLHRPLWSWLKESADLGDLSEKEYAVRRRVGNDILISDSGPTFDTVDLRYRAAVDHRCVTFSAEYQQTRIVKRYEFSERGLSLWYELTNLPDEAVAWQVQNGFAPSYYHLLRTGQAALEVEVHDNCVVIRNTATGLAVELDKPPCAELVVNPSMRYGQAVDLIIPFADQSSARFEIGLRASYEGDGDHE